MLAVRFDPPYSAIEQAGTAGIHAGQQVVRAALTSAIGPGVRRAKELLAAVQAGDLAESEYKRVTADIDRRAAEAPGLLFGKALDRRLAELEDERAAALEKWVADAHRREKAVEELRSLRDEAVSVGVKAVAGIVTARRKAATAEREQTAARLVKAVEGLLTRLLVLDAELGELRQVAAADEVKDHLETTVPAVFGEGGVSPARPYDWREELERRDEERERRRPTRRVGDVTQVSPSTTLRPDGGSEAVGRVAK